MAEFGDMFPGIDGYAQQQVGAQMFELDRLRTATAEADLFMSDPKIAEEVTRKIESIADLKGVGIVFRTTWGKARQVRLPAQPGDLSVIVTFGPAPADGSRPEELQRELRGKEATAGLACAAAVIVFVGIVSAAFVTGPVGWALLSMSFIDGVLFSTTSISCMWSGIRVLNLNRGNREANERMENNRALQWADRNFDRLAIGTVSRNAFGVSRASVEVVREIEVTREFANELLLVVGAGLGIAGSRQGGELQKRLEKLRDTAGSAVSDVVAEGSKQIRMPDYTVALSSN